MKNPTTPNAMPAIKNPKPSSSGRTQRKIPQTLVSAAVSIPPTLYNAAIIEARQRHENNFSRYVRSLIAKDLGAA
jgi:hypothetical protein